MGEIVEITTVVNQQNTFYRITSGSLRFQVRGPGNAGISLVKRPDHPCDFWVVIGFKRNTVVLLKEGKEVQLVPTGDLITSHHFREFWMQWHNDLISLGRGDSDEPFFVYKEDTLGLQYITFATIGQNDVYGVQWRFELPPLLEKIKIKDISSGAPEWKLADNQIPDGAVIGGYENEILYIIRAKHRGSLTPGKFVPSEGVGYIPWGGAMNEKSDFEVLCGYDYIWVPCSDGRIPAGAVDGGHSEVARERLYVGRVSYHGHVIPGKVQPSHNVCYIPYNDIEIAVPNYEILVVPEKNMLCANPLFMHDMKLFNTPVDYGLVPPTDEFAGDFD